LTSAEVVLVAEVVEEVDVAEVSIVAEATDVGAATPRNHINDVTIKAILPAVRSKV